MHDGRADRLFKVDAARGIAGVDQRVDDGGGFVHGSGVAQVAPAAVDLGIGLFPVSGGDGDVQRLTDDLGIARACGNLLQPALDDLDRVTVIERGGNTGGNPHGGIKAGVAVGEDRILVGQRGGLGGPERRDQTVGIGANHGVDLFLAVVKDGGEAVVILGCGIVVPHGVVDQKLIARMARAEGFQIGQIVQPGARNLVGREAATVIFQYL